MSGVCEKPSAANIPIEVGGSLTWQKLSPAEFQQLQDYMACKYFNNKIWYFINNAFKLQFCESSFSKLVLPSYNELIIWTVHSVLVLTMKINMKNISLHVHKKI